MEAKHAVAALSVRFGFDFDIFLVRTSMKMPFRGAVNTAKVWMIMKTLTTLLSELLSKEKELFSHGRNDVKKKIFRRFTAERNASSPQYIPVFKKKENVCVSLFSSSDA